MATTVAWKSSLAPASAERRHLPAAGVASQLQRNPNILHLVFLHESFPNFFYSPMQFVLYEDKY